MTTPVAVDRRTYIGGADAAAIVGVGLWGSPYSTWLRKVSPAEENNPTERMQWGLLLEHPVAKEWARRESVKGLRKATFRRHPSIPYIGGHPDFYGTHPVDGDILIETKLSDRAGEWDAGDGVDAIPLQYYLQVQHYLLVTGLDVGYLVVLIRGNELRSWRIPADPEIAEQLLAAYAEFWDRVQSGEAPEPDGHEATTEALRNRYPRADEAEIVADLATASLVESLLEARAAVKQESEREALIANRIKAQMGEASRLLAPAAVISWRNNKDSTKTDWQSVAKAYRAIIEAAQESPEVVSHDLDTLESLHTNTIPGARVFRVTAKSEGQG